MIFGGSPAAGMTVGFEMSFDIGRTYSDNYRCAIDFLSIRKLDSPDQADVEKLDNDDALRREPLESTQPIVDETFTERP
jgi:hypothetical protein